MKLRPFLCWLVLSLLSAQCGERIGAAEPVVGWRGDGSGRYAQATPPTHWSPEKNVLWKTPLPGRGYGSPILVGERIFVTSEPDELLCIRASDGEVLWQRSASIADVLSKEEAEAITAKYESLAAQRQEVRRQVRNTDLPNDQRAELEARLKQAESELAEFEVTHPVGRRRAGNTASTPISDGRRVVAVFGTGIVAAYTTDGEQLWARFVEGSPLQFGHSNSPVLIGDTLIVHFRNLIALDAQTGNELWRRDLPTRHASSLAVPLGDQHLLFATSGDVVRARDGHAVAKGPFRMVECSLIAHEGTVYAYDRDGVGAFRLPASGDEPIEFETLWKASSSQGRRLPSSIYHDGLLYGLNTAGILDVIDAETGTIVYRRRLNLREVYSSLALAGEFLYACGTDGTTVVFQTGRQYKEIARNELDSRIGSCPVFVADRMYLRTNDHLYCIRDHKYSDD